MNTITLQFCLFFHLLWYLLFHQNSIFAIQVDCMKKFSTKTGDKIQKVKRRFLSTICKWGVGVEDHRHFDFYACNSLFFIIFWWGSNFSRLHRFNEFNDKFKCSFSKIIEVLLNLRFWNCNKFFFIHINFDIIYCGWKKIENFMPEFCCFLLSWPNNFATFCDRDL